MALLGGWYLGQRVESVVAQGLSARPGWARGFALAIGLTMLLIVVGALAPVSYTHLLFYWQWGTGWHLSQQAANDPGERWVTAGTDDDVPVLMNLISRCLLYTSRCV